MLNDVFILLSVLVISVAIFVVATFAQDVAAEKDRRRKLDAWWDNRGE
jgi:ABC-type Na+ efflux pump permease subunit